MKITDLHIQNFKSIHDMHIPDIESALILVGQNNTGKTSVLDAIRAVGGEYQISREDFGEAGAKIRIHVSLAFSEEGGLAAGFLREASLLFRSCAHLYDDGK